MNLYQETLRPQFHFTARKNWINDPNGLVYYDGTYHLFFQHNPTGIEWGNMTWGHAVSRDLVHWRQLEHALLPDELGTMFSGSAVVDWGNTSGLQAGPHPPILLFYTAAGGTSAASEGKPFVQCLAYSQDGGDNWQKYAGNPILECQADGNRDPKVIWHAPSGQWIMTLYLSENDFALYVSPDPFHWRELQRLSMADSSECPDFFELPIQGRPDETRWVWMASNSRHLIGNFDGRRFTPESELRTGDWGTSFYACQTYNDLPSTDRQRVQLAWMRGGQYPGMPFNQQMTFPCRLALCPTPNGLRLTRLPIQQIQSLYRVQQAWPHIALDSQVQTLPVEPGGLWDISLEIEPTGATQVGLRINGAEVGIRPAAGELRCLGADAPLPTQTGRVSLRCLVDRTSLELFAGDGLLSMSSCYLPSGQPELQVYAQHGAARLHNLVVHSLASAWQPAPYTPGA